MRLKKKKKNNFKALSMKVDHLNTTVISLVAASECSYGADWLLLIPAFLWLLSQVWPISCSLGATGGFLTGLLAAPLWIRWHRKQLTYKLK